MVSSLHLVQEHNVRVQQEVAGNVQPLLLTYCQVSYSCVLHLKEQEQEQEQKQEQEQEQEQEHF